MSLFTPVLTAAASQAEDVFLLRRQRNIGGILPQVVVRESHRDELQITNHPVAGSKDGKIVSKMITDHAYKLPATLTMSCGWSESGALYNGMSFASVQEVYKQLLALQNSRYPFSIITGKRTYDNMLMSSLQVDTDAKSEYALYVEAGFKEIIIVETQQTTMAPAPKQKYAAQTAQIQNTGIKQALPVASQPVSGSPLE